MSKQKKKNPWPRPGNGRAIGSPFQRALGRNPRWQRNGFHRFAAVIKHSCSGFRIVFLSEQAFRWGIYLGVIFFGGLLLLGQTLPPIHWLLLIGAYCWLLTTELINSGLEVLCDLVHPDYHALIKACKDMGSAAVFLCYFFNGLLWLYLVIVPLLTHSLR